MDMGSSRGSSSADLGENAVEDDAPGDAVIPEEAGHPLSCEEAQLESTEVQLTIFNESAQLDSTEDPPLALTDSQMEDSQVPWDGVTDPDAGRVPVVDADTDVLFVSEKKLDELPVEDLQERLEIISSKLRTAKSLGIR